MHGICQSLNAMHEIFYLESLIPFKCPVPVPQTRGELLAGGWQFKLPKQKFFCGFPRVLNASALGKDSMQLEFRPVLPSYPAHEIPMAYRSSRFVIDRGTFFRDCG
jgi:hypothetical protein